MNLWQSIRKIDWSHLMGFSFLLLKRPLLIVPMYKATQKTLAISGNLYGRDHFKNGPANAFRHAYWNVALCSAIYQKINNAEWAMNYCEDIVNYYEKSTKNLPMDRSMDYHNNLIGRKLFLDNLSENEEKLLEILQEMVKNAKKVTDLKDFTNYPEVLVFLNKDTFGEVAPKKK